MFCSSQPSAESQAVSETICHVALVVFIKPVVLLKMPCDYAKAPQYGKDTPCKQRNQDGARPGL